MFSINLGDMSRDFVNITCAEFPGAERSDPWGGGHDAWKVGGKMFACVGSVGDGVSLKTPDIETAGLLIEMGRAVQARYFHRSWVHIPWGMVAEDELAERLGRAYDIIRGSLTRRIRSELLPRQGT